VHDDREPGHGASDVLGGEVVVVRFGVDFSGTDRIGGGPGGGGFEDDARRARG